MRRILLSLLFAAAAGCSGGGGEVPVNGIVLLDDQPLDGAAVTFFPDGVEGTSGGMARTGTDGRFVVVGSQGQRGLPPGRYKVTVSKVVGTVTDEAVIAAPSAEDLRPRQADLPPEYSDPSQTKLAYSVTGDGRPIEIKLDSKPKK